MMRQNKLTAALFSRLLRESLKRLDRFWKWEVETTGETIMSGNSESPYPTLGGMIGAGTTNLMNITPTMTDRLRNERVILQSKLAEVEAALQTIESHPEVQQVIDALTKLHWLR